MTNKVMWKGSAQGRMYTIGKNTIPAGDFLSRESDNNEKTSRDDRDHFFYFRWLSIDNEKRGGDETSPNRPCYYVETGEKYWRCARVILVTSFLIQHKGWTSLRGYRCIV